MAPVSAGLGVSATYRKVGLQLFSNRVAALAEMRRALRAGGRGSRGVGTEQAPSFAALEETIREVIGDELAGR
jgi:ubiquinone/menaquinone biosynthesis C-methylase UbiE